MIFVKHAISIKNKMTQDPYIEGLFKICSLYRERKEVTRELIESSKVVVTILSAMYCYLVQRGEIDPIDDTDRSVLARYLLEII